VYTGYSLKSRLAFLGARHTQIGSEGGHPTFVRLARSGLNESSLALWPGSDRAVKKGLPGGGPPAPRGPAEVRSEHCRRPDPCTRQHDSAPPPARGVGVTNVLVTTHMTKLYGKTPALRIVPLRSLRDGSQRSLGPTAPARPLCSTSPSDCYSRLPERSASSGDRPATTWCHTSASLPRTRRSMVTSLHGSSPRCAQ
jgi:hypothetical protein